MPYNGKIVVISDTHGQDKPVRDVIERESPFDILVHCGDFEHDLGDVLAGVSGKQSYAYFPVKGNCDIFSRESKELDLVFMGYNIFVTHGHRYNVRYETGTLAEEGAARGADIVLYGHTHVPEIRKEKGAGGTEILIINPGSLAYPKQFPPERTYAVRRFREGTEVEAEIKSL